MTTVNNFASLKLPKLEKCILEDSCTLEFCCTHFNVRTLTLKSKDSNLIAFKKGFTCIPCLEKLEELVNKNDKEITFVNKTPFVREIVDTKLDSHVFAGATITVQKSPSCKLLVTLEDRDKDIFFQMDGLNLALLLENLENNI